ncbi:hypothetical protein TcasGA2_TC016330 [Tribolium castaneum]|uniref:Uncharacterized protein n=1 Tax=Tribolium castaneum TaxID=7070 RepID=D7GYD3_TRICA|nr:hypothetical protein TcasGA2_TC016330 [Tribolium castaneum]
MEEKSDDVLEFLKSEEFSELVRGIVTNATMGLQDEIQKLRNEVDVLKSSNIDLIKLLTPSSGVEIRPNHTHTLTQEIKIQRSRDDGGYSNTNSSKLKTTIPCKNLTTRREQQKDLIDVGPKKLRDNNSTVKTADFDIEKVERDNDRSSNGWIQVQSKRRINKKWSGVRGKANTEKSSGLTAANRKAYIYAGNFENSTKEEDG